MYRLLNYRYLLEELFWCWFYKPLHSKGGRDHHDLDSNISLLLENGY